MAVHEPFDCSNGHRIGALGALNGEGRRMARTSYGQQVSAVMASGQVLHAGVFNEHQVRAAAGITLVLGAVAFVYAYFAKVYAPIQSITAVFFVEFAVRVLVGVHRSPVGWLAGKLVNHVPPHWVSAKPKRFAWTLGLVLSAAMTVITNAGIRGALPLSICLLCLALMWTETALGLCLGCEIHGWLVRRGMLSRDAAYEVCASGACAPDTARE